MGLYRAAVEIERNDPVNQLEIFEPHTDMTTMADAE
jgi:hypothetical protein